MMDSSALMMTIHFLFCTGRQLLSAFLLLSLVTHTSAQSIETKSFNIPSGSADKTLRLFSDQSGIDVLFGPTAASARTKAIKGEFPPRVALNRLLEDSGLTATVNEKTGAFTISRDPNGPRVAAAEAATPRSNSARNNRGNLAIDAAPAASPENEIITLNPFDVSEEGERGYRKLSTVTTSRIGVPILKEPMAIEVISGELLKDFSVTEANQVFRYSSTVVVSEREVGQPGIVTMRGFEMPRYVNGVRISSSASIEPYLIMDNIDRVEIAKGSVGLFFANTTPNGVANYITKKPQFTTTSSLQLSGGSYDYAKVVLDTQGIISRDHGIAWRLISSRLENEGRIMNQHREAFLLAPSVIIRPNPLVEVTAELNWTKQKNPYGTFSTRELFINAQAYADMSNPSQQILDFMKQKYNLPDDTAARAKVRERYAFANGRDLLTGQFVINWKADTFERTGVIPFGYETASNGGKINWDRFSPYGDKYNLTVGNLDGETLLGNVGIVLTPFDDLAIKYNWSHMTSEQDFFRHLILPNGGLRPDGRIWTNSVTSISLTTDGARAAYSDANMVDAVYTKDFFGVKNQFVLGWEYRRGMSQNGNTPIDYARGATTTYRDGSPLVGIAAYDYWDPFGGTPMPEARPLISGPVRINSRNINKFKDYYFSYRAQALEDRLNVLAGVRRVKGITSGRQDDTWTLGGIYELVPGFRVFGSVGKNVLLQTRLNISGPGVTPEELRTQYLIGNESGNDLEVGVKTDWMDNRLSGSISYYKVVRDKIARNALLANLNDPRNFDLDPNNNVLWSENAGKVQTQGIDGDIAWTPNRKLQIILNFVYAYEAKTVSDPQIDPNKPYELQYIKAFHRRPKSSPLWRTNLIAKYNIVEGPLKNFSFGGAVRSSEKYNQTDGADYDLVVPAETIIDVFAQYQLKVRKIPTDLSLNLVNLTNEINDVTRSDGFMVRAAVEFKL